MGITGGRAGRSFHRRARGRLETQEFFCVGVEQLRFVFGAEGDVGNPVGGWLIGHEGIVHGEHDAVDAHFHDAADEGGVGEVATGGDPEVLAEVVAEGEGRIAVSPAGEGLVDAPEGEGQGLAQMAQYNLEVGVGVEYAG